MKIVICDDVAADRTILRNYLESYLDKKEIYYEMYEFQNGRDVLVNENLKNFDIIFLDVHMPGMDGIDLGRAIRVENKKAKIAYVTGYKEYAQFAIDATHCFYYITKPVTEFEIKDKFDTMLKYQKDENLKIELKTKRGYQYFSPDEIYYFEHSNRAICAHTIFGRLEISATLNELEERVVKCGFATPHRAYLVNMTKIRGIHGYEVMLTNGQGVELSQRRSVKFKETYNEFMHKFLV